MQSDSQARAHLRNFFAHALGCPSALLESRQPQVLAFDASATPFSLFRKGLLILYAPSPPVIGALPTGACPGLLAAHPRLLDALQRLLPAIPDERLWAADTALHLTQLVQAAFPAATLRLDGDHLIARFISDESFWPWLGHAAGTAALLEGQVLDNLSLLSRYPGGIYAIHDDQGRLLSRAGIRTESAWVWELGVRTEREDQRGKGLAKAVVSAATEAVLAAGRVPLYLHSATNLASQKVALALGYQHYADLRLWALLE
jgi:RimJ/RimL family protein N-acetyltransferase